MMQRVEPYPELPLSRKPDGLVIAQELVYAQKSAEAALDLAVKVSGLDQKEVYIPLDIEKAHWSRMLSGDAYFPPNKIRHFCEIVGNRIYLDWQAHQVGCAIVELKTEAERRAEAAEQALADERNTNRLLKEIIATMGTGKR